LKTDTNAVFSIAQHIAHEGIMSFSEKTVPYDIKAICCPMVYVKTSETEAISAKTHCLKASDELILSDFCLCGDGNQIFDTYRTYPAED